MVAIRRSMLALLSVAAFLMVGAGVAMAATVPLPGNAAASPRDAGLNASACPAAGDCLSVGSYEDTSNDYQGLLETETGGTWTASEAALPSGPNSDPDASLTSLSCPSVGNCVAVGDYEDSNDNQQGVIETEADGTWTASEATLPSGPDSNPEVVFDKLSCPSVGNCVAVGDYKDSNDNQQGLIETEADGTWTASEATLPSAPYINPDVSLDSVSCPSAGNCVAVGGYVDSNDDQQGVIETETDGTWTASEIDLSGVDANTDPEGDAESVSCPSVGSCTVVGYYQNPSSTYEGFAESEQAGKWSPATALTPPANAGASTEFDLYVESVSCVAAGDCTAVGGYDDATNDVYPLVVTETDGSWAQGTTVSLPTATAANPQAMLSSVVCTGSGCLAGGDYEDESGNTDLLFARESGGTWSTSSQVASASDETYNAGDKGTPNESVACATGGYCMEGAYTYDSSTSSFTPFINSAPAAVATPSASASRTQATVSWSPPSDDGGLSVIGYAVVARNVTDASAAPITTTAGASARSATISGLTAGDRYTFTVVATNLLGVGLGATSATVVVPVPTPPPPSKAKLRASLKSLLAPKGAESRIKRLRKTHSFTFTYKPLESGTVTVKWYEVSGKGKKARKHLVASGSAKTHGTTKVKLKVVLNKLGKRLIKTHGKLELTAIAAFKSGGTEVSEAHRFELR